MMDRTKNHTLAETENFGNFPECLLIALEFCSSMIALSSIRIAKFRSKTVFCVQFKFPQSNSKIVAEFLRIQFP